MTVESPVGGLYPVWVVSVDVLSEWVRCRVRITYPRRPHTLVIKYKQFWRFTKSVPQFRL